MALIPLKLPPGVVKPATVYDARGRFYVAHLVRWHGDPQTAVMQPMGGWQPQPTSTGELNINAPARGMHAWRSNTSRQPYLALGTFEKLYVFAGGILTDITPSGLSAGLKDATVVTGYYGDGYYGVGAYGLGDAENSTLTEARTWQLDNFGEDLVAVAYNDGKLYLWDLSAGGDAAAIADAPEGNAGVVVTPEHFLVALGADGEGNKVAWADQESATDWTPTTQNQAGAFWLTTSGEILAGRRSRSETLIWTSTDLHAMRYIGGPLVYRFDQVGVNCGAISRHSMAVLAGQAYWMGHRSFFMYDGYAKALPSEIADFVFNNMNVMQASKITCYTRAEFGEVVWHYPSAASDECDRYVVYNTMNGAWYEGALARTSGIDRGAFPPLAAAPNGTIYQHEVGTEYDGAELPYAESGPIELGSGDRLMHVSSVIPDERTQGSVQLTIYGAKYPNSSETTYGPYTLTDPTDVRVDERQIRLRIDQVLPNWRVGTLRIDVTPGSGR